MYVRLVYVHTSGIGLIYAMQWNESNLEINHNTSVC